MPSIVDTSQEASSHVVVTVEASGLTSATDEAPPAGDRGVAPSGQGVPITFVKEAPVAHPTKPEASAWTKAVVHSVYTALQILIPCAWLLRYHRSGMSVWTASWVICSCMLTDSLDFNLRLVAYAWVIVDILVILAWSVSLALVNYINAVVGIGCCLTGAYILFKVWLAEDRLESEHGSCDDDDDSWGLVRPGVAGQGHSGDDEPEQC